MVAFKPFIVGTLAVPLLAGAAHGQDELAASLGVHLTMSFDERLMAGLGVDGRATFLDSTNAEASGFGPYLQATWLIGHGARYSFGLHGGSGANGFSYDIELGWTYRAMEIERSGHGVQLGFTGTLLVADLVYRFQVSDLQGHIAGESQLGMGFRYPSAFGTHPVSQPGRPARVDGVPRLASAVVVGARPRRWTKVPTELRSELGRSWLAAARAEASSVPAFLRLRDDLAAVGAPTALSRRAVRAARDEVRHARVCRELAGDALGCELRLVPPPLPESPSRSRTEALTALAIDSWRDGCLGEGAAARRAEIAARAATHEPARVALGRIARDEAEHAELAWSVLAHALEVGGAEVRDAVVHELESGAPMSCEGEGDAAIDRRMWARHGRLAADQVALANEEVVGQALTRARRMCDVG